MRRLKISVVVFSIALFSVSCKKDPMVDLIDTWEIEGDRGEITFNDDGTGYAILKNYNLLEDLELVYFNDMCSSGDTNHFEWIVTEQKNRKGSLELIFGAEDSTCSGSSYPNYKFYPGGNELNLGAGITTVDVHRVK
jgi:hypothetical protein